MFRSTKISYFLIYYIYLLCTVPYFLFIYVDSIYLFKTEQQNLKLFTYSIEYRCSRYTFVFAGVDVNKIRFSRIPKIHESPYINQTPYLQRFQARFVLLPILSVVVRVAHRVTLVQVRRSASQRTMPFIARNFLETFTNTRRFYRVSAMEYTVI